MKLHCLCDADNDYCLEYTLDSGKSIKKDSNYLHDLIMKMINPYLGKFHILSTQVQNYFFCYMKNKLLQLEW